MIRFATANCGVSVGQYLMPLPAQADHTLRKPAARKRIGPEPRDGDLVACGTRLEIRQASAITQGPLVESRSWQNG